MVGGQDVEALVAHERGGAGDRVESPLDLGPDALLGSAPTRPRRHWVRGAGEVEQVSAFGVVELERPSQRLQHAFGDAIHISALEASVVRNADAGEDGDLLAAQSRNAARSVGGQPDLVWGDPRAAGVQKLTDLAPSVHNRRVDPPRVGDPASTPINRDSHFPRFRAFLDSTGIFYDRKRATPQ